MLTLKRFVPPILPKLTGDWEKDGPNVIKAFNDVLNSVNNFLLSLEEKGALVIDEATIDGSVIGGTTAAAGSFEEVTIQSASSGADISGKWQASGAANTVGQSFLGINAYGWTGAAAVAGGTINFHAAETWSAGAQGTYISFRTVDIGGTTLAERVRVDSTGIQGVIGATTPAAGTFTTLKATGSSGVIKQEDTTDDISIQIYSDSSSEGIVDCFQNSNSATKKTLWLQKYGGSVKLATGWGAQALAGDGSASAPAYSFASSGNSDTGAYLSAADIYSIACGGVLVASFVQGTGLTAYSSIELSSGSAVGRVKLRSSAHSTSPGTLELQPSSGGSVWAGVQSATSTSATDGFLYIPTCAGTPTGTPTTVTGLAPVIVDTTNNKLYFYSGGSWRDAGP